MPQAELALSSAVRKAHSGKNLPRARTLGKLRSLESLGRRRQDAPERSETTQSEAVLPRATKKNRSLPKGKLRKGYDKISLTKLCRNRMPENLQSGIQH